MRRAAALITIVILLAIPFTFTEMLPTIGDPDSPANSHVSDYYIENAMENTNSPNLVTAVLADYRGVDTMLETAVMFLAGLGVLAILANRPKIKRRVFRPNRMVAHKHTLGQPVYKSINKDVMVTMLEPIILLYAVYVLFHGETSLGGGFQAGALIALAYILDVMIVPDRQLLFLLNQNDAAMLAGIGTSFYVFVGVLTLFGGGVFLEYGKLPFNLPDAELHSLGILLVETGVTVCVMATIIAMLNAITERIIFDDDSN